MVTGPRWHAIATYRGTAGPIEVPVIELHPQAVARYRDDVEALHAALSEAVVEGDDAVAAPLRALVQAVTVAPTAAGEPLEVAITGRLAALLGAPVPPAARAVVPLVAEARFERNHREENGGIPLGSWREARGGRAVAAA